MAGTLGVATIQRSLDPQRRLSLAAGDFGRLFEAYAEHVRRWELPLDTLSATMMREGLAALGLHLVTRPNDESVGVTINLHSPALNLFFTGDAGAVTVTGRAFHDDVQTADSSRLFVQSVRPRTWRPPEHDGCPRLGRAADVRGILCALGAVPGALRAAG
jgi:hypothetical protein